MRLLTLPELLRHLVERRESLKLRNPGGELARGSFIFDEFCLKYVPACAADLTPSGLDKTSKLHQHSARNEQGMDGGNVATRHYV